MSEFEVEKKSKQGKYLKAWGEDETTIRGLWELAEQFGEHDFKRAKKYFRKFCNSYVSNPEEVKEAVGRANAGEHFYAEEVRDRILSLDSHYVSNRLSLGMVAGAGLGTIFAAGLPQDSEGVNFFISLPYVFGLAGACIGAVYSSMKVCDARERFENPRREENE